LSFEFQRNSINLENQRNQFSVEKNSKIEKKIKGKSQNGLKKFYNEKKCVPTGTVEILDDEDQFKVEEEGSIYSHNFASPISISSLENNKYNPGEAKSYQYLIHDKIIIEKNPSNKKDHDNFKEVGKIQEIKIMNVVQINQSIMNNKNAKFNKCTKFEEYNKENINIIPKKSTCKFKLFQKKKLSHQINSKLKKMI